MTKLASLASIPEQLDDFDLLQLHKLVLGRIEKISCLTFVSSQALGLLLFNLLELNVIVITRLDFEGKSFWILDHFLQVPLLSVHKLTKVNQGRSVQAKSLRCNRLLNDLRKLSRVT